jgi:molybdate transport system substrate-binding protein
VPRLRYALALLIAVAGLAACGADSADGGGEPLAVFAASSLREVFPLVDGAPTYQFGGSDELATQIREGAPADVFAAASPKYPQELFDEGVVEEPVAFATNRLVVIVPADNPAGIESVKDVAEPGVRLVVGAEGVPVGDYTRTVLTDLGLETALDNVVSNEDDVKGVVSKVALGEADAGFVYATDVTPVAEDVEVVEIPPEAQPPVEYQVAVVAGSEQAEAARAFIDGLLSEAGREALVEAGFGVP